MKLCLIDTPYTFLTFTTNYYYRPNQNKLLMNEKESATTLGFTRLRITKFRITTISIAAFGIMTLDIKSIYGTLGINYTY